MEVKAYMVQSSVRIPESRCLRCATVLTATTAIEHVESAAMPIPRKVEAHPGAVSICAECGYIALFDDHLKLREASAEELTEIFDELKREDLNCYFVVMALSLKFEHGHSGRVN
jgi:uncharacterized protein with PIN domain